jgi:hypothetical protein
VFHAREHAGSETDMADRFPFAFDPRYERVNRWFGVTPERCWVNVTDYEVDAHFGRWQLRTPLSNLMAVEVTGPYAFLKTAGPARLGITDLGLTFASNGSRGVIMTFKQRVPGIEPIGLLRHGELTVTVADVDRFAELLRGRAGLLP